MKSCKACNHAGGIHTLPYTNWYCSNPLLHKTELNSLHYLITGEFKEKIYCIDQRKITGQCGPDGKYFE